MPPLFLFSLLDRHEPHKSDAERYLIQLPYRRGKTPCNGGRHQPETLCDLPHRPFILVKLNNELCVFLRQISMKGRRDDLFHLLRITDIAHLGMKDLGKQILRILPLRAKVIVLLFPLCRFAVR